MGKFTAEYPNFCLQGLAENKTGFGNIEVRKAAVNLVLVSSCTQNKICWITAQVLLV